MTLDPCSLPLDEGSCTAYTLRWYHRAVPGGTACHPFVYGGCGGNANRFGTREACERRCPPQVVHSQKTGRGLDSLSEGCTYMYKCLAKKFPGTGDIEQTPNQRTGDIYPAVEPTLSISESEPTLHPSWLRCHVVMRMLCWERS